MPETITIAGRIVRHNEPTFWGRITIYVTTGRIILVERGENLWADHSFGPECLIFSGFGDVHIHAREDETGLQCYKEDYDTATAAAMNGGVVHVSAMPNTPNPVTTPDRLRWHRIRVCSSNYPVVVLNYLGVDKTTTPLGEPGEYPYKVFFGKSVGDLTVMYAGELDAILAKYRNEWVSFHVEYEPIVQASAGGKTHSDRRPAECVSEGLRLLLPLIEKHNIKAKLCHWSTGGESLDLIAESRARGHTILLEVSPLHLFFNKLMAAMNLALWLKIQMNPAVQGPEHMFALLKALRVGFIDMLATDHAPHTEEEKHSAFALFRDEYPGKTNVEIAQIIREKDLALFDDICCKNNHSGAPWLDTYSLICCWLMRDHGFTPQDIARVAAFNPGQFVNRFLPAQYPGRDFGMGYGDIAQDYMGSLTVLNTEKMTTVKRQNLKTKVGWSALEGHTLPGAVEAVFIEGRRY